VSAQVGVHARDEVEVRLGLIQRTQRRVALALSKARRAPVSSRPVWDPVCQSEVRGLCGIRMAAWGLLVRGSRHVGLTRRKRLFMCLASMANALLELSRA